MATMTAPIADTKRIPVKDFRLPLSNTNLSYFVGLDAIDSMPQMFLSGDRNITGGTKLANGILELTTNHVIGWGMDMHRNQGNVALADGSVQGFGNSHLRMALANTGLVTNRLAMP